MLEDVDVDAVALARAGIGPQIRPRETDQVQPHLGEPVVAVRTRLRVSERGVHALNPPRLALDVGGRAMGPAVNSGGHRARLADPVAQPPALRSSSPTASTPFSVRIVSIENSQRS